MIHFSRVSGAYSVVDIRNLITSVCPKNFDSPIEKVVIPKHSDGTSKDHALILMRTESLAERVVRKLHNTTPKKVRLKVKIAKDGATDCAESESIDSLPVQLEGLSMRGGSFSSGTGESSTQATSYAPTESAASDITDPSGQTTDTGRRRSSLPIANGSFSIPGTSGFLGASDAQHDGNEEAVQYGDWNAKANDKERAYKEISSAKSGHGKEKRSKGHSSKNSGREKEKRSRK